MKLYIVKGFVFEDTYEEKVEVLEGMEEKSKSYIGNGIKINKNKIGVLREGFIRGSYQIILDDENEIDIARRRIKEKIFEDKVKELERIQKELNVLKEHDLSSEIRFREY